jgi:hypothetical protein
MGVMAADADRGLAFRSPNRPRYRALTVMGGRREGKRREEATDAFAGTRASGIDNKNEHEHDLKTPPQLSLVIEWPKFMR